MLSTTELKAGDAERPRQGGLIGWITSRYTRQGLWSLFLMCAFPQHAWTLILAFRDIPWVAERTNGWDAIGVVSYGLVYAFAESLLLFLAMALLGYLVSGHWDPARRVAILTAAVLMASAWAILEQLFFLLGLNLPGWLIALLVNSSHPLRVLYAGLILLVTATILPPVLLVARSKRAGRWMLAVVDRLALLTMFYLALDVIGLIIVIVRNV